METGNSWGRGEGWNRVRELIEAEKTIEGLGWDAARREQFFQRALARAEKERGRGRIMGVFAARRLDRAARGAVAPPRERRPGSGAPGA